MKIFSTLMTAVLFALSSATAFAHGSEATTLTMAKPNGTQFALQIEVNQTDLLLATANRSTAQASNAAINYIRERLAIFTNTAPCSLDNDTNSHAHSHRGRVEFSLIVTCSASPTDSLQIEYRLFADIDPSAQGVLRLSGSPALALKQGDNLINF